jgi:hypothetical protein
MGRASKEQENVEKLARSTLRGLAKNLAFRKKLDWLLEFEGGPTERWFQVEFAHAISQEGGGTVWLEKGIPGRGRHPYDVVLKATNEQIIVSVRRDA